MRRISSKIALVAAVVGLGVGLGVNAATSTATPTRSTADSPFEQRGDIRNLPTALQDRLELLANRPSEPPRVFRRLVSLTIRPR